MAVRYRGRAAQSVKNGRIVTDVSLCVGMSDGIGTFQRRSHSRTRHVDVTQDPVSPRHQRERRRSRVLAGCASSEFHGLATGAKRLEGTFSQCAGINDVSHKQAYHAKAAYGVDQHRTIIAGFGETEQRFGYFPGLLQLTADDARSS